MRHRSPMEDFLSARSYGVECCSCGSDDWILINNSFDHQFGTHFVKPQLECNQCGDEFPDVTLVESY